MILTLCFRVVALVRNHAGETALDWAKAAAAFNMAGDNDDCRHDHQEDLIQYLESISVE
jgi:hypothetical protein